ncbi:MAG: DUF6247 family protein [Pseudonocardiaceae bacterium]
MLDAEWSEFDRQYRRALNAAVESFRLDELPATLRSWRRIAWRPQLNSTPPTRDDMWSGRGTGYDQGRGLRQRRRRGRRRCEGGSRWMLRARRSNGWWSCPGGGAPWSGTARDHRGRRP